MAWLHTGAGAGCKRKRVTQTHTDNGKAGMMGRPKLDKEDRRQQVNVRVSPEALSVIKLMADAEKSTVPRFLEMLVLDGLTKRLAGKFK